MSYWNLDKKTGISIKRKEENIYRLRAFKKLRIVDSKQSLFESKIRSIGPLADYIRSSYNFVYLSAVYFPKTDIELIPPYVGQELQKHLYYGTCLAVVFTVSTAEVEVLTKDLGVAINNLVDHINNLTQVVEKQAWAGYHIKLEEIDDILTATELEETGLQSPAELDYEENYKEKERILPFLFHRANCDFAWLFSEILRRGVRKKKVKIDIELPDPKFLPRKAKGCFIGFLVDQELKISQNHPFYFDFNKFGTKHILLTGSTGSGKTLAAQTIVEAAYFRRIPVIVLDLTKQYTGFLEPCKDEKLLALYKEFHLNQPYGFPARIFTPGANVGLQLSMNLLSPPGVDEEMKRIIVREIAEIIANICELTKKEKTIVEKYIAERFENGESITLEDLEGDLSKEKILVMKLDRLKAHKSILFSNKNFDIKHLMKGINIIDLSHLRDDQIINFVYAFVRDLFSFFYKQHDSSNALRCLIVFEEAHKYLGKNYLADILGQGARMLRKKGCGLIFVSQLETDLSPAIRTNANTRIYMKTNYTPDLDRARKAIKELSKILPELKPGIAIFHNPEINEGKPVLMKFRPVLHSTKSLSNKKIKEFSKNISSFTQNFRYYFQGQNYPYVDAQQSQGYYSLPNRADANLEDEIYEEIEDSYPEYRGLSDFIFKKLISIFI